MDNENRHAINNLSPCPFCGTEPEVDTDDSITIIFCSKCYSGHGRCVDAHSLKYEDAVDAWNARADL